MALKGCRQIYETAFDGKSEKQNEEHGDLFDRIANHPILQLLRRRSRRGSGLRFKKSSKSGSLSQSPAESSSEVSEHGKACAFTPQGLRQTRFPARSISTNHLIQQRLRPIGLSKSDDEILNRASESPEEDEFLEDYVEGSHTQDLAKDLYSLHVSTHNAFETVIPPKEVLHKHKEREVPSRKPSPKAHRFSAHLTSSDTCYSTPYSSGSSSSITRPFAHSLSRFGSRVQPQRHFKDPNVKLIQREISKSQGLPSRIALHPLKLQSPPGTAPLPLKFSKKTPVSDKSPSSWFNPPLRPKYQKTSVKKSFHSESEIPHHGSHSQTSLSDSMEVLLDRGSQRALKSCFYPPSVNVKYSSTESMVTGSAMSSMESLRSSMSDGNKSSVSNESAISSYKSSSMGSDSSLVTRPFLNLSAPHRSLIQSAKFQILSPISDKSQEPLETGGFSQKTSPQDLFELTSVRQKTPVQTPRNIPDDFRNIHHILRGPVAEGKAGSDSGISTEYKHRSCAKKASNQLELPFSDLPFDMPKLRRRLAAVKVGLSSSNSSISSSATSSDANNVRLSLPSSVLTSLNPTISKLQMSSELSHTSSSNSSDWEMRSSIDSSDDQGANRSVPGKGKLALELGCSAMVAKGESVDVDIPLPKQCWYHGGLSRTEAESTLRCHCEGSYLVRSLNTSKKEYSLALKSARGFMHLKIHPNYKNGGFTLGRSEMQFPSVPHIVNHHSSFRIPIKGADHMVLLRPIPIETL